MFFKRSRKAGGLGETNTLGETMTMVAERGYHITLPTQQLLTNHVIGSWDRKVVISPLDCGLRIVGISDLANARRGPSAQPFKALGHHFSRLLPTLSPALMAKGTKWMGRRPTLPDSLPVVDCHPDDHRIKFAFGHQHLGVTQAAITAELLDELFFQSPGPDSAAGKLHQVLRAEKVRLAQALGLARFG